MKKSPKAETTIKIRIKIRTKIKTKAVAAVRIAAARTIIVTAPETAGRQETMTVLIMAAVRHRLFQETPIGSREHRNSQTVIR